jgi:hypothetical protein
MVETGAEPPPDGGSIRSGGARDAAPKPRAGLLGRIPGWYIVFGLLTLAFQVSSRLDSCAGAVGCGLSMAKALIWSAVWPLSWLVYWWGAV